MTSAANNILNQAIELSAAERFNVVEKLLISLDQPDLNIDAIWASESDARVEAYEKGKIETLSAEEVFKKYRNL